MRVFFNFVARQNFAKTKSRSPHAFIPQTPPADGKSAKAKRKILSPENIFPFCRVRIEALPHCLNTWRAKPQKEKCPFHFRKNPPPRKSEKQGTFFLFGVAE